MNPICFVRSSLNRLRSRSVPTMRALTLAGRASVRPGRDGAVRIVNLAIPQLSQHVLAGFDGALREQLSQSDHVVRLMLGESSQNCHLHA